MKNKNIRVAIRPHPRDEEPERYNKYSQGLKILDTAQFPSSEDLLPLFVSSIQKTQKKYFPLPSASRRTAAKKVAKEILKD